MSSFGLMFLRWLIGITFAVSAGAKVLDLTAFREALADLQVAALARNRGLAAAVVAAEALMAVLMVPGGAATAAGFVGAGVLLLMFTVVLVAALRRRTRVSCNCFGAAERRISWFDVIRNGLLIAGCAAGAGLSVTASAWAAGATEVLMVGLLAASWVAVIINVEDVVLFMRRPLPL